MSALDRPPLPAGPTWGRIEGARHVIRIIRQQPIQLDFRGQVARVCVGSPMGCQNGRAEGNRFGAARLLSPPCSPLFLSGLPSRQLACQPR